MSKIRYQDARVYIFSDSEVALNAIGACRFEFKLVWDCLVALKTVAQNNLANKSAESRFTEPEPFYSIAKNHHHQSGFTFNSRRLN